MTIIAAYQEAGTYRGAAAICGTTPKTVKRVIQRAEAGGVRPPPKERVRNFEVVADLVAARVKKSSGRITAKRLLPAARTAGYEGSARNFRRLVAQAKRDWRAEHHRGRRPAIWSPGEHLVIDWGSQGGVHVFCAVLAWSRWRFARFAADEKSTTTLAMLGECFAELGGTPQVVLADRMGCLKGGVVANRVIPTGEYVRFALHYRFRPDFCEAADPESKGIVENLVGYAKSDLLTPLLLDDELDLDQSNEAARAWCREVNAAVHSEIVAVPEQRLAQERPLLGALPSLQLRIGPAPVLRKVDKLSCVRIGSARYSVPMKLIGASVEVIAGSGRVLIVDTRTGEVMADHAVVAPGDSSVVDEHYGGGRPKPRRAIRPRTVAEKAFCGLGAPAEAFLAGAAAAGHTRLGPELGELNMLAAAHGQLVFLAALERATAFGRWRSADVRSILAAGTGTPQPRPAGTALVIDLPTTAGRSLAEYAPAATAAVSS
jgi:transposase